jgi:predicted GIY-YIG superfamily endonuclease
MSPTPIQFKNALEILHSAIKQEREIKDKLIEKKEAKLRLKKKKKQNCHYPG